VRMERYRKTDDLIRRWWLANRIDGLRIVGYKIRAVPPHVIVPTLFNPSSRTDLQPGECLARLVFCMELPGAGSELGAPKGLHRLHKMKSASYTHNKEVAPTVPV
jgi:hypothetical protein